jgi:hypothetical protein
MRILSIIPAAAALAAIRLSSLASAAETSAAGVDPASAIRGSLGASIADLGLDTSSGALAFLLNAGCVVLFAAVALLITRSKQRRSQQRRISLRLRDFAR